MENKKNLYKYPMGITQQFKHCGNPFRIDTYKGCNFGCKYCFANTKNFSSRDNYQLVDFSVIEKNFKKAFEDDKETKNLTIEMLRKRVPLHLGGMSDPFQTREKKYKLTYKLLELTKKYNYPMIISTKTAHIPEEYFKVLDPNIHAFQSSLISMDEEYLRKFETNTPTPYEKKAFIKSLRDKGFWVSVRIQPLINIEHAVDVVRELSGIASYITVEHLKIFTSKDDVLFYKELIDDFDINDWKCTGKNYELKKEIKQKNIELLKSISKCPIGCGDNDLHEFSDSNNCCGIDTINENFNGWIKYNSMYINKTGDKTQWYPKSNCSSCFNSDCRKAGFTYKDYVDDFIENPKKDKKVNIKL